MSSSRGKAMKRPISQVTARPPDHDDGTAESVHEHYFGRQHVTVIRPVHGWRLLNLQELWAYRELFWVLTARDVKIRYKQTVLGAGWAIIQPVMTMVVFSIFFGGLAKIPSDGFPYPVFVYAGLLPWTFFANSLTRAGSSVVGSANLISKIYFPRLIVPLSSVGAGIVDLGISAGVLLLIMLYFGVEWSLNLLAAPLLFLMLILLALGVGTFISALNVAYRDFGLLTPYLVQLWMFATPVIYPASLVPEKWRWLFYLNPMAGIIEGFRAAFLGKPFDLWPIYASLLIAIVLFIAGSLYFRKVESRFADII
jgi:homopolymeric O-antigen transport system permease protein